DVLEFFLHLLEQVDKVNSGNPKSDPSRNFKFGIEDRIQCPSGKVAYNKRFDYILSLNIPLHEATNKDQLEAFQKLKVEAESEGKNIPVDEVVRPRVPLETCLASYSAPEEVMDFYSTALKSKITATKTTGLTSFPDCLVLHMRKFVMEDGWVPKKLDVYIDVPDIIDISHMRSRGLQPEEELLPDEADFSEAEQSIGLEASEEIVSQLLSMGFGQNICEKAAISTSNAGVEEAMNWLLSHLDDPDINAPIGKHQSPPTSVDQSTVDTLVSFGFQEELARKALVATGGDIEKATDWIFSNPNASSTSDMDTSSSSTAVAAADSELPDGSGRYKLLGFVSHMGTSTHCGHYVAHIYKDGRQFSLGLAYKEGFDTSLRLTSETKVLALQRIGEVMPITRGVQRAGLQRAGLWEREPEPTLRARGVRARPGRAGDLVALDRPDWEKMGAGQCGLGGLGVWAGENGARDRPGLGERVGRAGVAGQRAGEVGARLGGPGPCGRADPQCWPALPITIRNMCNGNNKGNSCKFEEAFKCAHLKKKKKNVNGVCHAQTDTVNVMEKPMPDNKMQRIKEEHKANTLLQLIFWGPD
ncbi:hypothetical protein KSS87_022005, partial [Heliosperma pusillum]